MAQSLGRLSEKIEMIETALSDNEQIASKYPNPKYPSRSILVEMEESMEKAEAVFDAQSESGTALSASTVAMLEEVRSTAVEDAEAIASVAAGQKVDPEAMASRAQRRAGLASQLLETLGSGLRRCFVFMRYALQHLRDDLHLSQEKDSKKAASVVELLTTQLAALRKLPEAEKSAKRLLKTLRKLERLTTKALLLLKAVNNRLDEDEENHGLNGSESEESDNDSDSDDSDDLEEHEFISDLSVEQLQERHSMLTSKLAGLESKRAAATAELQLLLKLLPELIFHVRLPFLAVQYRSSGSLSLSLCVFLRCN